MSCAFHTTNSSIFTQSPFISSSPPPLPQALHPLSHSDEGITEKEGVLGPMGASGSRLGALPHRPVRDRITKRTLSSLFICGASSSHLAIDQIEDHPVELLVNSAKHIKPKKLKNIGKDTVSAFTCSKIEIGVSSGEVDSQDMSYGDASSNVNYSNAGGESFSENKELVAPNSIGSETTQSALEDQTFPISLYRMENVDNSETASTRDDDGSLVCAVSTQFSSSSQGISESPLTEDLIGIHVDEVFMLNNCDSASASAVLDSPVTSHSSRDDLCQQTVPSCPELLVSEREHHPRDGGILHVDMASISSNVHSSSIAERSSYESRRNNRRLFWDAFSRRRPRTNAASRTSVFSNDDSDDVGSYERWSHDLRGGSFHNGVGGNFRSHQTRSRGNNDRHSRLEMQDRLHGGSTDSDHSIANCPAGIHLDGACSCESVLMADEAGSRASVSRIVMLAEALFEVLDEIHRQPMTLSLSMASLPAPETIVDSFPVKNHIKQEGSSDGNEVTKCYICLAEYEEGDQIRVLPCHHEFHMLCVDKWLKEIHGVCPLCRGDVHQEGFMEDTTSNLAV